MNNKIKSWDEYNKIINELEESKFHHVQTPTGLQQLIYKTRNDYTIIRCSKNKSKISKTVKLFNSELQISYFTPAPGVKNA